MSDIQNNNMTLLIITINDNQNVDDILNVFKSQIHQYSEKHDNNSSIHNYLPFQNDYKIQFYSTDQTLCKINEKQHKYISTVGVTKKPNHHSTNNSDNKEDEERVILDYTQANIHNSENTIQNQKKSL